MSSPVLEGSQTANRPVMPENIAKVITDATAHADGNIHEAFAWLRANHPLSIAQTKDFYPFWVVTKHADIRTFATRPDLFLSGATSITLLDKAEHAHMRQMLHGQPQPMRMIINMDPPDHTAYRAVTSEYFTPREIEKWTETVRAIAREFVDRLAETGGECDFAETVAFIYPLRVVMSLLGAPASDEKKLLKLTHDLMGTHDPEQSRAGAAQSGAAAADMFISVVREIFEYSGALKRDRLERPRDDLATLLSKAQIDGKPMPTLESLSYYFVLLTAGHDTTAASTAGAMIELARNPAEFAKVKENPALIQTLVEEAVRWVSPSKMTMREASQDVELCGRTIRKGEHIALAWVSGNRDEQIFEDPFTFKVDRRPNRLLSFAYGPHVCLGQHLARLEMRVLFEELFKRLDSVELAGPTRSVCSFQVSGPKVAPIRFKMK